MNSPSREDLVWWIENTDRFPSPVSRNPPFMVITSDASNIGWDGPCGNRSTGGMWKEEEISFHIKCLELKAALFTLKALCKGVS